MTATFNSRLYNIAAYLTVPAAVLISWFLLYTMMMNTVSSQENSDNLYVRIMTATFLLLLPIYTVGIVGALLSLFLTSVRAQKILAGFAVLFNLTVVALVYIVLLAAAMLPTYGIPRTEANLAFLLLAAVACLLYASYLCFLVWKEADQQEEIADLERNQWRRSTDVLQQENM